MIATEMHMRQHATKMGRRTAFHAEAERVRQLNSSTLRDLREIYQTQLILDELRWQRRNSYSARRKRFEASFASQEGAPDPRPHPPVGLWREGLVKTDIRAFGAKKTGIVDVADHRQGMWWYQLTYEQQLAIIFDSESIHEDERLFREGSNSLVKMPSKARNASHSRPL